MNSAALRKLILRYRRVRLTEILLFSGTVFFILLSLLQFIALSIPWKLSVAGAGGLASLLIFGYAFRLIRYRETHLVSFLNSNYEHFEQSADLLLRPAETLPLLQQLQLQKLSSRLGQLTDEVRFPNRLVAGSLSALLSLIVFWFATTQFYSSGISVPDAPDRKTTSAPGVLQPISAGQFTINVTPPGYMHRKSFQSKGFPLNVPEGSRVQWEVNFIGAPSAVSLVFSGKENLPMTNTNQHWSADRVINATGFYQLEWNTALKKESSDFHSIEITPDAPPQILVESPASYTELQFSSTMSVQCRAVVSDEYGLGDVSIIATVSKGSGESVKFREEKLLFDQAVRDKTRVVLSRTIDLTQLGLSKGDELYFYIEASDQKTPQAGKSRTETFFVTIKDTAKKEISFDSGMGVDIMPEYFRSQRQIIIDSEKLLEEKKEKRVTTPDFNSRSNNLAYDQRQLRLRYGQFMGEEAEEGEPETPVADHDEAQDVVKKFGHTHDTNNESNLVPDAKTTGGQTLFAQSLKAKLRTALNLMWDAELHLRLNDPAKSLPFQYKILKLLKEISNDSRVYVRRTGFDPPPVKEDKRLKGEQTDIHPATALTAAVTSTQFPAIAASISIMERATTSHSNSLTPDERKTLQLAGNELAGAALTQPARFLKTLMVVKHVVDDPVDGGTLQKNIASLLPVFYRLIPTALTSPSQKEDAVTHLDSQFLKNLEIIP